MGINEIKDEKPSEQARVLQGLGKCQLLTFFDHLFEALKQKGTQLCCLLAGWPWEGLFCSLSPFVSKGSYLAQ